MGKFFAGVICGILIYYCGTNLSELDPNKTILERRIEDAGKIFNDIREDFSK
jgi:hypothetical protein